MVEASAFIPGATGSEPFSKPWTAPFPRKRIFPSNLIVVDNFSTDGTTELLAERAKTCPALHSRIPVRDDLDIGGCWNEAVSDPACGRYAVQLDSDDLYSRPDALHQLVNLLASFIQCSWPSGNTPGKTFNLRELSAC